MTDLEKAQGQITLNQSSSFDPSIRLTKSNANCSESTTKEIHKVQAIQLQRSIVKFKQQQIQCFEKSLDKAKKSCIHYLIGVVLIFLGFLIVMVFMFVQTIDKLQMRISQLEHKNLHLKEEISQLDRIVTQQKDATKQMELLNEKIKQQIIDLHMNELIKQEKSMHILQKYSSHFQFQADTSIEWFQYNFKIKANGEIKKISDEQLMFYSTNPIPRNGIFYLKIKIVKTLSGMISFGIIPETKKQQTCVYCDSSEIFYIYCYNGEIYHGQILKLVNKSKKTKFEKIVQEDVITMFVDTKGMQIIWYVNSRYAGSESLKGFDKDISIYPFIEMTSRRDQIMILP